MSCPKNCLHCGAEFFPKSYEGINTLRWKNKQYCSRKCVGVAVGKLPTKPWNKGKELPKHLKKQISQKLKGRKMPYVAEANKNRDWSEETRKKRSEIAKSLWNDEFRERFTERMTGQNNPNWIEDRSQLVDRNYHPELHIWKKKVAERDQGQCQINNEDCAGRIEIHHILPYRSHPELRFEPNNGITLCHHHHPRKHSEEQRLAPLFFEIISSS